MTNAMTFREVLESEFYYIVEAIEHGSSDKQVIESYKAELLRLTGYKYID